MIGWGRAGETYSRNSITGMFSLAAAAAHPHFLTEAADAAAADAYFTRVTDEQEAETAAEAGIE